MDIHFKSVAGQMLTDIGALDFVLLAAFVGDDDDFDAAAVADDRYGIGDGAGGGATAVPANHHIVGFEWSLLNVRHHDYRPAGLEQRGLADDLLHTADFRLRLADDRKIEAARHAGEVIAGAGKAGAGRQRVGGNPGLVGGGGKTLDGGFGGGFVIIALRLNDLSRNIAGAGNRHDGVVNERDAGQVRFQGGGD